jgi:hypothetical protein
VCRQVGADGTSKGWRDFLLVCRRLVERSRSRVGQQGVGAKSMTARSPNDSAGEHNKGSGWTASLLSEGGRNETKWSGMNLAQEVNAV